MSWFDASGLASIAKTALKEAQRTIDKALDIQEDVVNSKSTGSPVDTNSDDFFDSWGISQSGNINTKKIEPLTTDTVIKSPTKSSKMTTSIWGSFTGSFFDGTKMEKPRGSIESLDDSLDLGDERFSSSKLVVQQMDDLDSSNTLSTIIEFKDDTNKKSLQLELTEQLDEISLEPSSDETSNNVNSDTDKKRMSVGSCKTSSDSVEIVGEGTDCTTSPDSESYTISSSSSALDHKHSESVEVLPDSLTSPSSVEVLSTGDAITPSGSLSIIEEFVTPMEKTTPDSIEVIVDELDDISLAEDSISYASISESTFSTVLETSAKVAPKNEPITRGPSRSNINFSLSHMNSQLIDTQPCSNKENSIDLVENPNVIDIPQDTVAEMQTDDDGSHSDRTIIADDNVMESSSDTSTTTEGNNANSYYLKNLLADAMCEQMEATQMLVFQDILINAGQNKSDDMSEITSITQLEMPQRDNSPLSSESRSDLVKIGSDETSGHTSGDENETTTSSDIEIISSPNGDSSSTQSRHSPVKWLGSNSENGSRYRILLGKSKITPRDISGLSSGSEESYPIEVGKLIKRLAEVTNMVEVREAKLIETKRQNAELQEVNNDLQSQLDSVITKQVESLEISQVTEEYTQRLSVLEKKFQQAIRDKDILKKQLDQSKSEASGRISKGELESVIIEKDSIIKELREEGEKLSKQQLQHSNIIKKLRSKEKEQETSIRHLKENIDDLTSESERLKRSMLAKEEVECTQIEAVHQLTSKNKKLEYEITQLKSQLDDVQQKYDTVKKSLEAAKKELIDKNKANLELHTKEQKLQSLENEKRKTESQNEEIIHHLEDLRYKLQQSDEDYLKKEQVLRSENNELVKRLEEADRRNEELAQSVMEISKPLVRQLESLQTTHNIKLTSFDKIEQQMQLKINELQSKLQVVSDNERIAREECLDLKSRVSCLETQLNTSLHENQMMKMEVEQQKTEKVIAEQDIKRQLGEFERQLKSEQDKNVKLISKIDLLDQQLSNEKHTIETERKQSSILQEQIHERIESSITPGRTSSPTTGNTSPTLSLGRLSISESLGSSVWIPDDQLEINVVTPRYPNMLELQMLQSNLKQKEGEVQQLQWELNRREQEKNLLSADISKLITRVEDLEVKGNQYDNLQVQFTEVQQKYETLCQLYGEKVEETEELKLDLLDVKELYKSQLDELINLHKK